jgi:hypothetical protein
MGCVEPAPAHTHENGSLVKFAMLGQAGGSYGEPGPLQPTKRTLNIQMICSHVHSFHRP